jgi:hypothetical protein
LSGHGEARSRAYAALAAKRYTLEAGSKETVIANFEVAKLNPSDANSWGLIRERDSNPRPQHYEHIPDVLHFRHMGKTLTIRLTKELATWLEQASKQSGVPKGRIVREQLEKARDGGKEPSFMRLAGSVHGARDLSTRKGFSRS